MEKAPEEFVPLGEEGEGGEEDVKEEIGTVVGELAGGEEEAEKVGGEAPDEVGEQEEEELRRGCALPKGGGEAEVGKEEKGEIEGEKENRHRITSLMYMWEAGRVCAIWSRAYGCGNAWGEIGVEGGGFGAVGW